MSSEFPEQNRSVNPYQPVQQDMFSARYQHQAIATSKYHQKNLDIVDRVVFFLLRRLIHIFVALACISCMYMFYIMEQPEPAYDRYEQQASRQIAGLYHMFLKTKGSGSLSKKFSTMVKYYDHHYVDQAGNHSTVVHPLYIQLQNDSPLQKDTKSESETKIFYLTDYEYNQKDKKLRPDQFYQRHVSKSLPCIFRNEVADEDIVIELSGITEQREVDKLMLTKYRPLLTYYPDDSTTAFAEADQKSGYDLEFNITILHNDKRSSKEQLGNYDAFIKLKQQQRQTKGKYHVFIEDQPLDFHLKSSEVASAEVKQHKHLMSNFMKSVDRRYTQWSDFVNRRAKRLNYEQHVCVYHGREQFILVSPIYKKNLYVNVFDQYHGEETPIDFFKVNYQKFPLAKEVNWLQTTLEAGDCMYVPAYFYVQSKSLGLETIMMAEQYESHSKYIDLIFKGLDSHGLEEQDKEEKQHFDQAIENVIGWMGLG